MINISIINIVLIKTLKDITINKRLLKIHTFMNIKLIFFLCPINDIIYLYLNNTERIMKSFLIVTSLCLLVLLGVGLTLSLWQIPIPISEKTLIIPNETFNE